MKMLIMLITALVLGAPVIAFAGPEKAGVCLAETAKKVAIEAFIEERYGRAFLQIYPREGGQFGLRFYPGEFNCMGEVYVGDDCEVRDIGMTILTADGLVDRAIECWNPDNEQG